MFYAFLFINMMLSACTYNISMAHTEGSASDVIDETTTPSTTVSPTLNVPAKAL